MSSKSCLTQVALFVDARIVGGIENHIVELYRGLRLKKVEVTLFVWQDYPHSQFSRKLANISIPMVCVHGSFRRLIRVLKSGGFGVLHSHGYKANILGRLAAKICQICSVATHHNGDLGDGVVRLYTWLDQVTAPWSTNITVSQEIAQRLPVHSHYVENFVAVHRSDPPAKQRKIAFVGRFEPVKRPDRFLHLAKKFKHHSFIMIGAGSLLEQTRQLASENCDCLGYVENMTEQWAGIDVLIICSQVEGLPLAALEAMAHGVPVISLALGSLPDVIEHRHNGYIATTVDELESELVHWLHLSNVEQQRMRKYSIQKIAKRFSVERGTDSIIAIYQHALQ